jgi:cell division protein FtsL
VIFLTNTLRFKWKQTICSVSHIVKKVIFLTNTSRFKWKPIMINWTHICQKTTHFYRHYDKQSRLSVFTWILMHFVLVRNITVFTLWETEQIVGYQVRNNIHQVRNNIHQVRNNIHQLRNNIHQVRNNIHQVRSTIYQSKKVWIPTSPLPYVCACCKPVFRFHYYYTSYINYHKYINLIGQWVKIRTVCPQEILYSWENKFSYFPHQHAINV